jgi:hypothetical protein
LVSVQVFLVAALASALVSGCKSDSEPSTGPPRQAKSSAPRLALPSLADGESCPVSNERRVTPQFGPALGVGPVYPVGIPHGLLEFIYAPVKTQLWYPTDWGGEKVLWVADPSYAGPILIRGGRIDAPGRLGFGDQSMPDWKLSFPAGEAIVKGGWRQFPSYTRLKAPGCYAYQIDGDGFQTLIVFKAAVFADLD